MKVTRKEADLAVAIFSLTRYFGDGGDILVMIW
jgi:hypothetical protein